MYDMRSPKEPELLLFAGKDGLDATMTDRQTTAQRCPALIGRCALVS